MTVVRAGVRVALFLILGVTIYAAPAYAHPGHGAATFGSGLIHPFAGLDHLLAMVAVGLLAARSGGRGLWMLPASFVGFMLVGGLLGLGGIGSRVEPVEWAIAGSVLVFGLMIALLRTVPLAAAGAIVALFALFHGHAHIVEMLHGSALGYMAGMLLGTAILHGAGLAGGITLQRVAEGRYLRLAGAVVAIGFLWVI